MLPQWSPDGHLLYIHDKTNWWNLYRHDNGAETNLCPMDMEIGGPHWVFGQSPYSCDPKGSGDMLVAYGKVSEFNNKNDINDLLIFNNNNIININSINNNSNNYNDNNNERICWNLMKDLVGQRLRWC